MNTEVLIVGAGPAGLSAASFLGSLGIETVVVDEYPIAGGRLLGQLYRDGKRWWSGRQVADRLMDDVGRQRTVTQMLQTSVVSLHRDGTNWATLLSGGVGRVHSRAVLVATGAAEVPVPLPGWTLPGVITVGAAQTMANVYGVRPGRRGILVGFGALAFAVAQELNWAGVDLRGVVLPAPYAANRWLGDPYYHWQRLRTVLPLAPVWMRSLGWLFNHEAGLRRAMAWVPQRGIGAAGARVRPNVAALEILGSDGVRAVRLVRLDRHGELVGRAWEDPVDFVALSGGLRPVADLASAAGALMHHSGGGLYDVPLFGPLGQTSLEGLFAAGNILGIEGARIAMAQGKLAAVGIARLVRETPSGLQAEEQESRAALVVARKTAPLIFDPTWALVHREVGEQWRGLGGEGAGHAV